MQFQFDDLAGFLSMNGHGPYVWASYGVALLVMATLAMYPLLQKKKLRREFEKQLRQEEARRRAVAERQPQPEPVD